MKSIHLFEGYGIELEYMIVDRKSLDVMPIADRILEAPDGKIVSEIERGEIAWSNELVLHVIELKTNGPAKSFSGLGDLFHRNLTEIDGILESMGGRLMPSAAHPWMNPMTETRIWPHEYSPIYGAYDRIFGCQGHGWSNLQSMHINLPFADDDEFGRLHAAIRLLMPILPAIAASSPVLDRRHEGFLDARMEVYRHNADLIPAIAGHIIPEPVFSRKAYEEVIFRPMYRAIAPHDPENVLRDEFLNSRGAIARFERNAIEIRVLDINETPYADIGIAALISAALRTLVQEEWSDYETQQGFGVEPLSEIFLKVIRDAEDAAIDLPGYAAAFGYPGAANGSSLKITAKDLWAHISESCREMAQLDGKTGGAIECILETGPLARRILKALDRDYRQERLHEVYLALCESLSAGQMFIG